MRRKAWHQLSRAEDTHLEQSESEKVQKDTPWNPFLGPSTGGFEIGPDPSDRTNHFPRLFVWCGCGCECVWVWVHGVCVWCGCGTCVCGVGVSVCECVGAWCGVGVCVVHVCASI